MSIYVFGKEAVRCLVRDAVHVRGKLAAAPFPKVRFMVE